MKHIHLVRGILKEADERQNQVAHNAVLDKLAPLGQKLGSIGHQTYLNPQNRREFIAVDTWDSLEGLRTWINDPSNPELDIEQLFEGKPEVTIWVATDSGWKNFLA